MEIWKDGRPVSQEERMLRLRFLRRLRGSRADKDGFAVPQTGFFVSGIHKAARDEAYAAAGKGRQKQSQDHVKRPELRPEADREG